MFTRDDLLEALRDCFVPLLRRDVIAAGLLRTAELHGDIGAPGAGIPGVPERLVARIVLTAPGADELVNAQVRAAVENRLLGVPAISRVELTMVPALFPILGSR